MSAAASSVSTKARIWLAVRGTLYPPYVHDVLDDAEAEIVNRNIHAFIRAYNRKTHEIEGVDDAIVDRLVERCTSASPVSRLDDEIDRLRRFRDAGLTEIALRIYDEPEKSIRLLGERVAPALRS